MGPQEQDDQALKKVCAQLQSLRVGIIDTSTLIYLDTLGILPLAGQWLQCALIPQVVAEFGRQPLDMHLVSAVSAATTDDAILETAILLQQPLLSEDGRLLRKARQLGHPHYNCLMLLVAFYAQGVLAQPEFFRLRHTLLGFARYGTTVRSYADQVIALLNHMPPPTPKKPQDCSL